MRSKLFVVAVLVLAMVLAALFVYAQDSIALVASPEQSSRDTFTLNFKPAFFAIPLHDTDIVHIPESTGFVYLYAVRAEREGSWFVPNPSNSTLGHYIQGTRTGVAIVAVVDGKKQELLWWAKEGEK